MPVADAGSKAVDLGRLQQEQEALNKRIKEHMAAVRPRLARAGQAEADIAVQVVIKAVQAGDEAAAAIRKAADPAAGAPHQDFKALALDLANARDHEKAAREVQEFTSAEATSAFRAAHQDQETKIQDLQQRLRSAARMSGAGWGLGLSLVAGGGTSAALYFLGVTVVGMLTLPIGSAVIGVAVAAAVGLLIAAVTLWRQKAPKSIVVAQADASFPFAIDVANKLELLGEFSKQYAMALADDAKKPFAWCRMSRLDVSSGALSLQGVFKHALKDGGKRSYRALQGLGWLDAQGKLGVVTPDVVRGNQLMTPQVQQAKQEAVAACEDLLQTAYNAACQPS